MIELKALRRAAIVCVALAVVVCIVSTPFYFAAFGWDLEAGIFVYPESVLEQGRAAAVLWRWGFLGDLLYSYLLLLPLALFLHRRLRDRQPWLADVGLAGALAYILIGGAAAAILAQAGSSLIVAYHAAAPTDQPAILIAFHVLRDSFVFGVWQTLDGLTAGIWVLSVGLLLLADRRWVGRLLVVLGRVGVGPRGHDDVRHSLVSVARRLPGHCAGGLDRLGRPRASAASPRPLRPSNLAGRARWSRCAGPLTRMAAPTRSSPWRSPSRCCATPGCGCMAGRETPGTVRLVRRWLQNEPAEQPPPGERWYRPGTQTQ